MKSLVLGATAALVLTAGLSARQATTTPPPATAQTTPTAPVTYDPKSPVGPWIITITLPAGSTPATSATKMDLQLEGKKLSGSFVSQAGAMPVAGEFADGKISFTIAGPDGAVQATFKGKLNDNGTLSGTMPLPGAQAELQWKAERPKS